LDEPAEMESRLEAIEGVVACGIFAHRRADVVIVGHEDGSVTIRRP
jgi:ribose 5-phosphate isomerase A